MPEIIRASFSIVTPMYIGDADQKATGISSASIKGALRFWWRAIHWGRIRASEENDVEALQQLHQQEGELFGSSAETGTGQAQFLLRIKPAANLQKGTTPMDKPKPGIQYLLGQGLYGYKEHYKREAIQTGAFTVECIIRPTPQTASIKKQLAEALLALGTLGGIGSRARKGFGSIAIQSLDCEGFNAPSSVEELKERISSWKQTVQQPPFTAFSRLSRIDISITRNKAMELLNEAGEEQQMYRSYGRKGAYDDFHKVNGQKAEQNFSDDHDDVLAITRGTEPKSIPQRSVFGLPHNYFFSSASKNIEFTAHGDQQSRRASPLLIHVHQFPNGKTALVQTLLPALFLTDNTQLEFKVQRGKTSRIKYNQSMIQWDVIHKYMDRFTSRERIL